MISCASWLAITGVLCSRSRLNRSIFYPQKTG